MRRSQYLSVALCSLALIATNAQPAAAYGSKTPPVRGKWIAVDSNSFPKYWRGTFTITHNPVAIHHLVLSSNTASTTCDEKPMTLIGTHKMHLFNSIDRHNLRYTGWAIGKNDPSESTEWGTIIPVPVTWEQGGREWPGKLKIVIQFPRGGAQPKTDGYAEIHSFGAVCEPGFTVHKA